MTYTLSIQKNCIVASDGSTLPLQSIPEGWVDGQEVVEGKDFRLKGKASPTCPYYTEKYPDNNCERDDCACVLYGKKIAIPLPAQEGKEEKGEDCKHEDITATGTGYWYCPLCTRLWRNRPDRPFNPTPSPPESNSNEVKENKGVTANYMQTVPDSHFWTSIEMLIGWAKYHSNYNSRERSVEYLVKGLENTLKNGYDISKLPSPTESNSNEGYWKRRCDELMKLLSDFDTQVYQYIQWQTHNTEKEPSFNAWHDLMDRYNEFAKQSSPIVQEQEENDKRIKEL